MIRKTEEIRESEWRELLEEYTPKPPANGRTIRQIAAGWNCTIRSAQNRLMRHGMRDRLDLIRVGAHCYYVPKPTKRRTNSG